MKKTLLSLLILASLSSFAISPKREIRGAWLTVAWRLDWPKTAAKDTLSIGKQKRELVEILNQLQFLNFNTLFLQVRLRSDLIYPSQIEPFSSMITGKSGWNPHNYDPLQFAIDECHKRGIECHAWLVCIPIGNDKQMKTRGSQSLVAKRPDLCKRIKGEWFLDPGIPETATYLSSITSEITRKYDIDGIHLDYIRYPEIGEFPDKKTKEKYGPDENLADWRRANINRIVYSIHDSVKSLKPWVQISAAVIGKYNDLDTLSSHGWNSYAKVYQDPKAWKEAQRIDFVAPMMYFSESVVRPFLRDWKNIMSPKPVVVGLGTYKLTEKNWPLSIIQNEVEYSQQIESGGQTYFRTEQLIRNSKKCADWLKSNAYLYPALMPITENPDFSWVEKPMQLNIVQKGDKLIFSWDSVTYQHKMTYNLYLDKQLPINNSTIENLISCRIEANHFEMEIPDDWEGEYYFGVTANNRFHYESKISSPRKVIFHHKTSYEK